MYTDPTTRTTGLTRRHLLQGAAGAGAVGLAGCLGSGGDDKTVDPVRDRISVDPADVVEGGTFRVAAPVNVDSFDPPYSTSATASAIYGLLYEGMITVGADGQIYPWLAKSIERADVQDVGSADYVPYMRSIPYVEQAGSTILDTDRQIVLRDPNAPADPSPGDTAQVLTVADTQAAVDAGVYGMSYRISLHEGVTFHDGEELTAENVVASYYRYANSPNAGQLFDSLLHVQADDRYTVEVYAQVPDAAARRALLGWPIFPTAGTDRPDGGMDPREGYTPVGTGPWELLEFQNEEYVRFGRTDDYWFSTDRKDWFDGPSAFPDGPVVDEVDVSIVRDNTTRSAALQNDEVDMTFGLNASDLTSYRNAESFRVAATDGAGFTFLQFPITQSPWDDRRLRTAVNHLIPRQQIADQIFQGWQTPAWTPLPPLAAGAGTTDYDAQVERHRPENAYDPERANELVETVAAETDLEPPISVTLETNAGNDDRVRLMELVTESLNQSESFEATLETREFLSLLQALQSGAYAERERLVLIGLSGGFNPHGYAKALHSPENIGGCCNFQNIDIEAINTALADARYGVDVVEDPTLRQQRYEEVWDLVIEHTANAYVTHDIVTSTVNDQAVYGFNTFPSSQSILGYGLYAPVDEQLTYLDRA